MKPFQFISILVFFISSPSYSQLDWAKHTGPNNGGFIRVSHMITDENGNSYSIGWFAGTIDFNPSYGFDSTYYMSASGNTNVYVQKLNSSGNFIWAKSFGGNGNDQGNFIDLDLNGDILITGLFEDTADLDPNIGVMDLISNGYSDAFIAKLDPDGNLIWAKSIGGPNLDSGHNLAVSPSNKYVITGTFSNEMDLNPNAGVDLETAIGSGVFIISLDENGNYDWGSSISSMGWNTSNGVDIDDLGNILITGHYEETIDLDPGAGVYNITSNFQKDAFVLKLDQSGNLIWGKSIGGDYHTDAGKVIKYSSFEDCIYVYGEYRGSVDFNSGRPPVILSSTGNSASGFILKLDSNGILIWAKALDSQYMRCGDLLVDPTGIHISGDFGEYIDFDPSPNIVQITNPGYFNDGFLAHYDTTGNLVWHVLFRVDFQGIAFPNSIARDSFDRIYLSGMHYHTVDFDPGPDVYELGPVYDVSAFTLKLGETVSYKKLEADYFQLYPNPATSSFQIVCKTEIIKSVSLIDNLGRIVTNYNKSTLNSYSLNNVPPGIYFILINDKTVLTKKLVVI